MAAGSRPPAGPRSNSQIHAPANPSGLRQSYTADWPGDIHGSSPSDSKDRSDPDVRADDGSTETIAEAGPSRSGLFSASPATPTESTALLRGVLDARECSHEGLCSHGTFSPRPSSPAASIQSSETGQDSGSGSENALPIIDGIISTLTGQRDTSWRRKWARNLRSRKMSTSSALAERHGFKDTGMM